MTIAFLSIFIAGFVLAAITWVVGELFEFSGEVAEGVGDLATDVQAEIPLNVDTGVGVDLAGTSDIPTPTPVSSRVVFSGLTAFGGFGFIGSALGWAMPLTLLFAVFGFVLASAGMFFGVIVPISRQQGWLRVNRNNYMGMEVHVATSIPVDGVGQVTFEDPNSGAMVTEAASSVDGAPIAQGTPVTVVRVVAGRLIVAKAP